jgi:hypothetical protein
MTPSEALNQAMIFNDLCRKNPWLDIDLVQCSPQSVILHGGIDLSVGPDIELRFDTVFFACLLMTWKTDTSLPVLQVLTGEEAIAVNGRYRVEHGYHLFTFQPEYVADGVRCMIAAKTFCWRLPPMR